MSEIMMFNNQEFGEIRTLEEGGVILFCASDVAKALGYKNPTEAIQDHCKKVVDRCTSDSLGRRQTMKFIPEGDIYRLVASSRLPGAEKFESWVFDEVIPSIRKHGAYMTPDVMERALSDPDFLISLAQQLKDEREKRNALQAKVEEDRPKVEFYNDVTGSGDAIEIGEVAKLLDMGVGRNKLFSILREEKILMRDNIPYQEFVDRGYFEVIETRYQRPNGDIGINLKTLVFQKGVDYIRKVLNERGMRKRKKERKRERNKYESRF